MNCPIWPVRPPHGYSLTGGQRLTFILLGHLLALLRLDGRLRCKGVQDALRRPRPELVNLRGAHARTGNTWHKTGS